MKTRLMRALTWVMLAVQAVFVAQAVRNHYKAERQLDEAAQLRAFWEESVACMQGAVLDYERAADGLIFDDYGAVCQ